MPCSEKQRRYFWFLRGKKRRTKAETVRMKGLASKCELKSHIGGDRKMVKRRKSRCRARKVMVGRNRCATVNPCTGRVVRGRVKCGRKVAGKSRRARVYTKPRKCKHGHIKGSKKCRKTSKRRVVKRTRRRRSRKVPCSKHPMMKKCRGKKRRSSRRTKRRSYL